MASNSVQHSSGPDISFPSLLSIAQLEVLDQAYMDWLRNRRITIALLARSGRQLAESFDKDPGRLRSLCGVRSTIADYQKHLIQALRMTDKAMDRLGQVEAYLAQNVAREVAYGQNR